MYQALLWNQPLEIETTEGLFSPRGADAGTLSMVSAVELESGQKLLDLGCGAGLVGIAAAKVLGEENVWMTDVDPAAVRCAAENAKRNGVENVHLCCGDALDAVDASGFDWILSNPPYHADFSVAKKFIEKGFNRLKLGGKLVMVVKRELWYRHLRRGADAGDRRLLRFHRRKAQRTLRAAEAQSAQDPAQRLQKEAPRLTDKRTSFLI